MLQWSHYFQFGLYLALTRIKPLWNNCLDLVHRIQIIELSNKMTSTLSIRSSISSSYITNTDVSSSNGWAVSQLSCIIVFNKNIKLQHLGWTSHTRWFSLSTCIATAMFSKTLRQDFIVYEAFLKNRRVGEHQQAVNARSSIFQWVLCVKSLNFITRDGSDISRRCSSCSPQQISRQFLLLNPST